MTVLLVTTAKNLAEKFAALNPELEYCAIVTDDVEAAKKTLAQIGLSKYFVCSMTELIKCVEYLWYDYILCVQDYFYDSQINKLIGLPKEKVISFAMLSNEGNWETERHLRYYREHAQDFEMFATGTSPTEAGIDVKCFKYKAFNFATSSQDLYYNFQIAKHVILFGREYHKFRCALIGLTPYFFHFDLSKTLVWICRLLPYFIAFNNVHTFHMPVDVYKKFFCEEWLTKKPSINNVNINGCKIQRIMTQKDIDSNASLNPWTGKYYPKTRDENIKILDDYLTLCEENNIRPVMFTVPVTEKYMTTFNKQLLEEFHSLVGQALSKHPDVRFLDGWKLQGFNYPDFYNHAHLNINGAAKFSTYLNDFIEQLDKQGG